MTDWTEHDRRTREAMEAEEPKHEITAGDGLGMNGTAIENMGKTGMLAGGQPISGYYVVDGEIRILQINDATDLGPVT